MPVEDNINLDKPLTEDDFSKMEQEAKRLAEIAERARGDAKDAKSLLKAEEEAVKTHAKMVEQLEKQRKKAEADKLKIGRTVREVNELSESRSPTQGVGGEGGFIPDRRLQATGGEEGFGELGGRDPFSGAMKRGRREGQTQRDTPMGNIINLQEQHEEALKLQAKRKSEVDKQLKEQARKHAELVKKVNTVEKGIDDAMAFTKNPTGWLFGKIQGSVIGKLGLAGMGIMFGMKIYRELDERFRAMFKDGGLFDRRKLVLDVVNEIAPLNFLIKIQQGQVYFTSDTAENIRQGVPQNANTRELVLGHKNFVRLRDN